MFYKIYEQVYQTPRKGICCNFIIQLLAYVVLQCLFWRRTLFLNCLNDNTVVSEGRATELREVLPWHTAFLKESCLVLDCARFIRVLPFVRYLLLH